MRKDRLVSSLVFISIDTIKRKQVMRNEFYEKIKCNPKVNGMIFSIESHLFEKMPIYRRMIPAHWHRSVEISYIYDGIAELWIDGKCQIINNDFSFINSGVVHELKATQSNVPSFTLVVLSYEYLKKTIENFDDISFKLNPTVKDQLINIFKQIKNIYDNNTEYSYLMLNSLIDQIIYILCNNCIQKKNELFLSHQKFTKDFIRYINDHYNEKLTLEDVASNFGLSKEYFSKLIHQKMGVTFLGCITQTRLHFAYDLLLETEQSIQEISDSCGFSNVKSFISSFKEVYKQTPSQYRKLSQNIAIKY